MALLKSFIVALLGINVVGNEDCSLLQMNVKTTMDAQSILHEHSDDDAHITDLRASLDATTHELSQLMVDTFWMVPGVQDAADDVVKHSEFHLLIDQVLHLSLVVQAVADHVSQMSTDPSATPELNVDTDFDMEGLESAHSNTQETFQGWQNAESHADLILGVHSYFEEAGQYWTGAIEEFGLMEQQMLHLVQTVQALVDQVDSGVHTDQVSVSDETESVAAFTQLHDDQARAREAANQALGSSVFNNLGLWRRVVELGYHGAQDHHAAIGAVETRIQHLHTAVQALALQVNNL